MNGRALICAPVGALRAALEAALTDAGFACSPATVLHGTAEADALASAAGLAAFLAGQGASYFTATDISLGDWTAFAEWSDRMGGPLGGE